MEGDLLHGTSNKQFVGYNRMRTYLSGRRGLHCRVWKSVCPYFLSKRAPQAAKCGCANCTLQLLQRCGGCVSRMQDMIIGKGCPAAYLYSFFGL